MPESTRTINVAEFVFLLSCTSGSASLQGTALLQTDISCTMHLLYMCAIVLTAWVKASSVVVQCQNEANCTADLSKAVQGVATTIVLQSGIVYRTLPLHVNRSDFTILLCEGTQLEALRGGYHGLHDMLLTIRDSSRVQVAAARHPSTNIKMIKSADAIWPWEYASDVLPPRAQVESRLCKPATSGPSMPVLRMWQEDYINRTMYNGS